MANTPEKNMGPSVKSPTSATDPKNMGGMPESMDVKAIFAANSPPSRPADSSVADLGEKGFDGK